VNCERCKKRVASGHLTESVGGEKRELGLCVECAAEEGVIQQPGGMEVLATFINRRRPRPRPTQE